MRNNFNRVLTRESRSLNIRTELFYFSIVPKEEKRAFGAGFPISHLKRYFSLEIVLWDTDIRKLVEAWRSKQRWLEWDEFTYVSSESKFFRRVETYLAMVKCSHFPKDSVIEVGSLHTLAPFLFSWWATCNVGSEKQSTHLSHETDRHRWEPFYEWSDVTELNSNLGGKSRLEWDSSHTACHFIGVEISYLDIQGELR